jgi:hypothetical protein
LAENRQGTPLPLMPHTKLSGIAKAEFSSNNKISLANIFIEYVYKLQQNRVGSFESTSPDYSLLNLGISAEIKTRNNPI